MTPADAARGLMAAYGAGVVPSDDEVRAAAEALADAADSADVSTRSAGLAALFGGVVEPLNDGFTRSGRALAMRVLAQAVLRSAERDAAVAGALRAAGIAAAADLIARREQALANPRPPADNPLCIAVLSRVTIGADVLLTSVLLQRLRQRFPDAELLLLGDRKIAGLFGGLPGLRVLDAPYRRRGSWSERLAAWPPLRDLLADEGVELLVNPDSRLDQLGLLPLLPPDRCLLWENTFADAAQAVSLADHLDAWCAERLDLSADPPCLPHLWFDDATAATAGILADAVGPAPLAAVKFDHGGNPAKALPGEAEALLLRHLRDQGWRILLDRGFGDEELAASDRLLARLGWTACDLDDSGRGLGRPLDDLGPDDLAGEPLIRLHGSIGTWAAGLSGCGLALAYDSAGHHLAAALGVPLVVAFTGHPSPAFARAWSPRGRGEVTVVEIPTGSGVDPAQWKRVCAALPAP